MSEYNEQLIRLGWLTKSEMYKAIEDGFLDSYCICYTKDTHEQFLIDSNLSPVPIKSRVRIYANVDSALEDIKSSTNTYAGEIISIREDDKFVAYIVNQFDSGDYYIAPIYSDKLIDYDSLQNVPIINIEGTVQNPIIFTNLSDGTYKVTGHFISPSSGKDVSSIVGNFVCIETSFEGKSIKRITEKSIFDYFIDKDGNVTVDKYITENYLKQQGYATEEYVDLKISALDCVTHQELVDYVATTCAMLVQYLVTQELNARYSTNKDIEELFS